MNKLGIYIHVPFCVQKCRYCDFYSMPLGNERIFAEYKEALIRHFSKMAMVAHGYVVDSVYFGGGTPSILPAECLCEILDGVRQHFKIASDCEITLEMNPKTASFETMCQCVSRGFNRLSIGCQSADDGELKMLGRLHTFDDFCQTVTMARNAGFQNISADLMLGLPDQDWKRLSDSIDRIAMLRPEHISVYGLKIEEGTWFGKHRQELALPTEDTESELYLNTVQKLDLLGYHQYEISNFSKDGYASRHNLKYWKCKPYLGFGPSAYSFFENNRYGYKRDLVQYIEAVDIGDFSAILQDTETISDNDLTQELLLLGLRLKEGITISQFSFEDGIDLYLQKLISEDLAVMTDGRLHLTARGMLVDNYITSDLLLYLK